MEIAARQAGRRAEDQEKATAWNARGTARGYRGLYMREVSQAEHGVDCDFLTAAGPRSKIPGPGLARFQTE